jgi:hypothetical protein
MEVADGAAAPAGALAPTAPGTLATPDAAAPDAALAADGCGAAGAGAGWMAPVHA